MQAHTCSCRGTEGERERERGGEDDSLADRRCATGSTWRVYGSLYLKAPRVSLLISTLSFCPLPPPSFLTPFTTHCYGVCVTWSFLLDLSLSLSLCVRRVCTNSGPVDHSLTHSLTHSLSLSLFLFLPLSQRATTSDDRLAALPRSRRCVSLSVR